MPLTFQPGFAAAQGVPAAAGKDIGEAAFGNREGGVEHTQVVHFHLALLMVLLEPFRPHPV